MTQPAETHGYDVGRHIDALVRNAGAGSAASLIDACIVNDAAIPPHLVEKYAHEQAAPVACDREALAALGIRTAFAPLVTAPHDVIRHDHTRLARLIMQLLLEARSEARAEDADSRLSRRSAGGQPI